MIEIIKYKGKIMLIYLPDFQQNVVIEIRINRSFIARLIEYLSYPKSIWVNFISNYNCVKVYLRILIDFMK